MSVLRAGLFWRYAGALMAMVALLILGSGALYVALIYAEVRESAARVQQAEARAASVRIDQFLTSIEKVVAEASNLPWESGQLGPQQRREEYHRIMKLLPAVAQVRWVDARGLERLLTSGFDLDEIDSRRDASATPAFAQALANGVAFGRPYFREGSEPFVTLGVRDRGSPPTVTLAEIDLKFVADLVRAIQLGKQGRVYVVDGAGTLIAHPNIDLVLRRTDLSTYAPLLRDPAAVGTDTRARMIEAAGLESGRVLVSVAPVRGRDWRVVAEQPEDEVMAPVHAALLRTGFLAGAGLLVALAVSYWLARRLSRPILRLRQAAGQIARGDLSSRIEVRTGDEVEALADDFNRMADQVREYTTGLERKVEERTSELRDALRARALFLAAASHDLRQPLYAISILADTLALESLPQGARETLAKQREAIAVLRGLFDNLLDLSRFDSGGIRMNPRAVPLREILAPIAVEHEVVCRAKGLRWDVDIADVWVVTDPELVRRIAANLLSNAVRYTPRGSVSLVAERVGAHVRLVVSDTGIGIAPEDQERVFEEFVQLDNPSRERDRGVGLGLSIVKKISGLLGANLQIESAPGTGTRISIDIPLAEEKMPAEPAAEPRFDPSTEEFAGLRIWAVEDDPLVRGALRAQFEAWGVDYAFAASRAEVEALHESDGGWPDGVMLDDMLGHGERGLAIAEWLARSMPRERLVLVTGNVEPAAVERLGASGLAVFRKPLAAAVLARWLAAVARSATTTARAAAPSG